MWSYSGMRNGSNGKLKDWRFNMTHSKGPWNLANTNTDIIAPHPGATLHIAKLWDVTRFNGDTEANGHLIAAAPEMLEALEAIIYAKNAEAQYGLSDSQVGHMFATAFNQARAAIAKARGVK
jgi:hypothetical protein